MRQTTYVKKVLADFNMEDSHAQHTPASPGFTGRDLTTTTDDARAQTTGFPFAPALGCLTWVLNTRVDLTYTVGVLALETNDPTLDGIRTVKRAVRYLKGVPDIGIVFDGNDVPAHRHELFRPAGL